LPSGAGNIHMDKDLAQAPAKGVDLGLETYTGRGPAWC
jgi:hypothetical protein